MSDKSGDVSMRIYGAIAWIIVGWTASTAVDLLVLVPRWEREAVKHNAAHYDSQTGKWQWNDDKPEKQP